MSGDNDDILDINLDGADDDSAGAGDVLDVVLDPTSPHPSAPSRKPSPVAAVPDDADTEVPMTAGGVCPRCGYALRPLEVHCPRCAKLGGQAPPPGPVDDNASPPLPELERPLHETERSRGCLVTSIIGGLVLVAIAVGVPIAIWMQPAQRAKREYELGLQAQIRVDFQVARQHYDKALQFDPNMGLAAFSMGTTYLRVGDPALVQAMQEMVDRAIQGQTGELDKADEWFRRALQIGQTLPPSKLLMDQRIKTPAHLRAFSRASLALTAFIRASAAIQADQYEQASAWIQVATSEAQSAMVDDPGNGPAQQVLRSVAPLVPPASGLQ